MIERYEPKGDRWPEELYHECRFRRLCDAHFSRHTDYEEYVWDWCGCDECDFWEPHGRQV